MYIIAAVPEGLSRADGLTGEEAASDIYDSNLLVFIPPGVHDVTTYHVFAPLPDWGAFMKHMMVEEQDQPRIGADFALFIPFIIEECCLASFKLTFASIEIYLRVVKTDSRTCTVSCTLHMFNITMRSKFNSLPKGQQVSQVGTFFIALPVS